MSGALNQALEAVGRGLQRGILEAEGDLAEARERCRSLETEVRALRAALRPMAPAVAELLSLSATQRPHPAPPDPDGPGSVERAEPNHGTGIVALPSVETPEPPTVTPPPEKARPADDETSTDYMPMLEELWGIARRDASS